MRKLLVISALLIFSCPVVASAVTGIAIGGKVGYASYSGDVLPNSGDLGSGTYYGAIFEIGTMPVVDLELHVNYFQKSFQYEADIAGFGVVSTEIDFRDVNALALLKKNLISAPMSPIGLYIGGGAGAHVLSTELAIAAVQNPTATLTDNLSNSLRYSAVGLVGLQIGPPMAPLALYGEARYGRLFTDEPLNISTVEGGILLKF